MPPAKMGFNRVLDDLAKRQLLLDFQFGSASKKYEAQKNIGAGAFGIVCEAVESTSKQKFAIKKIGHASATPTLARRTLREIRVLRYINHDNIIRLDEIFRTPGPLGTDVFMVMELMDGSLHQVIYGEPIEDTLVAHFLLQILLGLRYLHSAGIAHRDLKPSNLLVNKDCTLKIADFGMAKLAEKHHIDEVEEHCFYMTQHVATLPYRAPELLFVMSQHSTAVDMWAVGCILAEMFLRRELFSGRSVSVQIKIILNMLGAPENHIIEQIKCERTRKSIENYSDSTCRSWSEIMKTNDRIVPKKALDLLSQLCEMDPSHRAKVDDTIHHPFIQQYKPGIKPQRTCPFKVKMDMAAVESMNHQELTQALNQDVLSHKSYT
ncbi:unnamed protein product [Auanema sp. JU1783]|nr:unnamed protein product [Auanema sp. JU1783]